MTAVEKYTKIKDFNPQLLGEEIDALTSPTIPAREQWLAGFERSPTNSDHATPISEASKVVGKRRVKGETPTPPDIAVKGELRFTTRNPLTAAMVTAVDGALDAHVASGRSTEQQKEDQTAADVAELQAKFDLGITDPDMRLLSKLVLDLSAKTF
jgi:hypothetical protein